MTAPTPWPWSGSQLRRMCDQAKAVLATLGMPVESPWTCWLNGDTGELFLDCFHALEWDLLTVNAVIEATEE